jgi:uncharacterized protein
MRFQWDETKNISNIKKHGIDFVKAAEAFDDANQVSAFNGFYESEERWSLVGFTSDLALIVVIHVFRDAFGEDIVRIISARPATRHERNFYARENDKL